MKFSNGDKVRCISDDQRNMKSFTGKIISCLGTGKANYCCVKYRNIPSYTELCVWYNEDNLFLADDFVIEL